MSVTQGVVITFRLDVHIARILQNMPNRSAFIRQSIEQALGNVCPMCSGSGCRDHHHVGSGPSTHTTQTIDVKGT